MLLSIPKNKAAKDPYACIAGPKREKDLEALGRERQLYQGIKLDSRKYLYRPDPYPYRAETVSCLAFEGWEPSEFAAFRPLVLRAATDNPGAFVKYCSEFPETPDEQIDFFIAAGFLPVDAERLVLGDSV